jgi:hypothetical protein
MILRALQPAPLASSEYLPTWKVVERIQRQPYESCWMITQPSHAALAGEFAARITGVNVPKLDSAIIRAIALHDAGWGVPDSQAIMQSRSMGRGSPRSFIDCAVSEFVEAWEKSIDVAASTGPAGGYIVSRHFCRIAESSAAQIATGDRERAARFLEHEAARQKQLAAKQDRSVEELEVLTDVLQFCDLLSLYVCSGARANAEFPEYFGMKVRLTVEEESYRLEPQVIEPGTEFAVAALRHPATKEESGREIEIKIG